MTDFGQRSFDGRSKADIAIDRIRFHVPQEGYWLAFSGGKDSCVILDLAKRSGVKFKAHYSWTGVDPPELLAFVKTFPEVQIHRPERTMWELIDRKKMLPLRVKRFCCEWLKERITQGKGYTIMTGIRWAESTQRSKRRRLFEICAKDQISHFIHPVIDWTTGEVWDYLRQRELPYCSLYDEGASGQYKGDGMFRRLGCILCPMAADPQRDIAKWPRVALAYQHAAERVFKPGRGGFASGEEYFRWWLSREGHAPDEQGCLIFEDQ